MTVRSALYRGIVTHERLRPKPHLLRYRVFWLLADLDRLDADLAGLKLMRRNRWGLLSFHDRDHGDGGGASLRAQVAARLSRAGVAPATGSILLLTMPRVLGYVFNPISVYYCHNADGHLVANVYEVTSTFGVRHAYVLPVHGDDVQAGRIRQSASKALHVSPFMPMDVAYAFKGAAPDKHLRLAVNCADDEGPLLNTAIAAQRRALTDREILGAWLSHPLMTIKVVAGIHWEALRIWLKGVPPTPDAPAPEGAVFVRQRR